MSVLIQKKDLLEAVQIAFPIVPSKSSLQILSNFRLSYSNSVFEITATDADHSLRVTAGASGEGSLDITVNAKKIFEIVSKALPDGGVNLSVDGTVLSVESEKGFSCKIAGADSNDFPGVPVIEDGVEFNIGGAALKDLINKSSFAVSTDESRASLCGILWEVAADKTGMIATDGHRLGYSFINTNLPVTEGFSRIISQKSVSTLKKITDSKNKDDFIKATIGEKYVSFETPSFTMVSKLIDSQYPDYTKVIPKNNPKVVIADRAELCDAIRHVSVMSNKNNLVKFNFDSGKLEAAATNRDIGGEAKEAISVNYDGGEHTVGFNGQYFTEILEIIKTKQVRIEMNTQISACLIFPEYEDAKDKISEDLYLIMPLRIIDEA